MRPIDQIRIGTRSQATTVLVMIVAWWLSVFLKDSLLGFRSLFWMAIAFFVPLVATAFAVIAWRSSGGRHRWWVRVAALAAATPWVALVIMFLSS